MLYKPLDGSLTRNELDTTPPVIKRLSKSRLKRVILCDFLKATTSLGIPAVVASEKPFSCPHFKFKDIELPDHRDAALSPQR